MLFGGTSLAYTHAFFLTHFLFSSSPPPPSTSSSSSNNDEDRSGKRGRNEELSSKTSSSGLFLSLRSIRLFLQFLPLSLTQKPIPIRPLYNKDLFSIVPLSLHALLHHSRIQRTYYTSTLGSMVYGGFSGKAKGI